MVVVRGSTLQTFLIFSWLAEMAHQKSATKRHEKSDYEKLRDENVKRNEKFLGALGIELPQMKDQNKRKLSKKETGKNKKKKDEATSSVERRASSRTPILRALSHIDVPMALKLTAICKICKYTTYGFTTQQEAEEEVCATFPHSLPVLCTDIFQNLVEETTWNSLSPSRHGDISSNNYDDRGFHKIHPEAQGKRKWPKRST